MKERKRKVHSLIDKVYSLTNLDLAWAKVKSRPTEAVLAWIE